MAKKKFERNNSLGGRTASRVNKLISQRRQVALDNRWDRGPRVTTTNRNKDWKRISIQSEES
jgi:hypothetical protein